MIFQGSAVALVTPFNSNNEINFFELHKLIEFQIASGTKALVILGTTGESSTISSDERTKIIKFCVGLVNKRIPIIVGTGSNSTQTAINQTKEAENLGADGVLIVTPYYNKTSQNGLYLHYKSIAKETKLPIIIYNVPSRTGMSVQAETVKKLSKIKNIVGIKDASGNIAETMKLFNILPKNFAVYSGDDNLTYPMMCLGAKGVISVTANAYPNLVSVMCDSLLNHDYSNAFRIHKHLYNISNGLFLDINPICIKYYLNLLKRNVGRPRQPLTEPSEKIKKKLERLKRQYEN